MIDHGYILSAILITAAITWGLRAVSFVALAPLQHSSLLAYLGERMPVGIMVILSVYTVQDMDPTALLPALTTIAGLVATIALHMWRGNATLSIFGGTGIYVVLATALNAVA